ncbi:MAG: TatD family hydrolase [Cyclobacteriaceae bacterium]
MPFVDTHAHIYNKRFHDDIEDVIKRAKDAGVERIFLPNIDSESIDGMLELEQKFPEVCVPAMGLHPCHVNENLQKELYLVEEWLDKRDFVAVGEIGTDLYWDKTNFDQQADAFNTQSELAIKHNIPVIIHCRDSIDQTIDLVEKIANSKLRGIFHCFTGTEEQANQVIGLGFKIGIGGVATFKNGGIDDLIRTIDLEHIVLETDSPYLAPVPYRGKRNEPSYVIEVARKVAELKLMNITEVGRITTQNAYNVYGMSN